jgi:hypothetical protein
MREGEVGGGGGQGVCSFGFCGHLMLFHVYGLSLLHGNIFKLLFILESGVTDDQLLICRKLKYSSVEIRNVSADLTSASLLFVIISTARLPLASQFPDIRHAPGPQYQCRHRLETKLKK